MGGPLLACHLYFSSWQMKARRYNSYSIKKTPLHMFMSRIGPDLNIQFSKKASSIHFETNSDQSHHLKWSSSVCHPWLVMQPSLFAQPVVWNLGRMGDLIWVQLSTSIIAAPSVSAHLPSGNTLYDWVRSGGRMGWPRGRYNHCSR